MCYTKPRLSSIEDLIAELETNKECIVGTETLSLHNGSLHLRVFNSQTLKYSYVPYNKPTQELVGKVWIKNLIPLQRK